MRDPLQTTAKSDPKTAGGVSLCAFGKHPGWDDHIEDLGLDTPGLAELKRWLYVEGIGACVNSGAWDQLPPEQRLEGFGHLFVQSAGGSVTVGRLWSSQDGKGRGRYPMVVCAAFAGVPLGAALARAEAELAEIEPACRATGSAEAVVSLLARHRQRLQQALPAPAAAPEGSAWAALAEGPWGPDGQGLLRVLYAIQRELPDGPLASEQASPAPAIHVRVPWCADTPAEAAHRWLTALAGEVGDEVPLCALVGEHRWLDLFIGRPGPLQLACLRTSEAGMALTSDVPFSIDDAFAARVRQGLAQAQRGLPRGPLLVQEPPPAAEVPRPDLRARSAGVLQGLRGLLTRRTVLVLAGLLVGMLVLTAAMALLGRPADPEPRGPFDPTQWEALVGQWAGWFKPVYDDLAADGTTRRNWQAHEPLAAALASLEGTANEGADLRFIERVNRRGDSPDILVKNPPEEARQNPDPIGPTLTAMTAFRAGLLDWFEGQAALYDARGWAVAAGEVRSYRDLFAAGTAPQTGVSASAIAAWAEQMAQAERAWLRVEAACDAMAATAEGLGGELLPGLRDRLEQELAGTALAALPQAATAQAERAEAILPACRTLAAWGHDITRAGEALNSARLPRGPQWLQAELAGAELAELPSALEALARPDGAVGQLHRLLMSQAQDYDLARFVREQEPTLPDSKGLALARQWHGAAGAYRFVAQADDPRRLIDESQPVADRLALLRRYPDHEPAQADAFAGTLSQLQALAERIRRQARPVEQDLPGLQAQVASLNEQRGALWADLNTALDTLRPAEPFESWLARQRAWTPAGLAGPWGAYLDSVEQAEARAGRQEGTPVYTPILVERVEQAKPVLDGLSGELPEPPGTLVEPARAALQRMRAEQLAALAEAMLPPGAAPLTGEAMAPRLAQAREQYLDRCDVLTQATAEVANVTAALAELDLEGARRAYAAMAGLHRPGWLEVEAWEAMLAPAAGPMAALAAIEAESAPEPLIERVRPDAPAPVVWAAWLQLGQLDGWPATAEQLRQEQAMQPAVTSALETVDGARRDQLAAEAATERAKRWQKCLASAASDESMEAVLDLRPDFGVRDDQLPPWAQLNLALYRLRQVATGPERLDDAQTAQAIAAFRSRADALGLGDLECLGQLPRPEDRPAPLPLDQCGPAAGEAGWQKLREDAESVTYAGQIASQGWELTFRRVEVAGRSAYLCTTEVPVGLVVALTNQRASQKQGVISLLALNPADLPGPRVWRRVAGKVAPAVDWVDLVGPGAAERFYPPGTTPGPIGPGQPMQDISPEAALAIARALGCRLPTPGEWQAALRQSAPADDFAQWNLRDETWGELLAHVNETAGRYLAPLYPDAGAFLPTDAGAVPVAKAATHRPGRDGTLWFEPVDAPRGEPFRHLIGNVAEFVLDDAEAMDALSPHDLAGITGCVIAREGALFVIGGSALSAPELAVDQPLVWSLRRWPWGAADVGFRLAFSAPATPLQTQLRTGLQTVHYLKP